MKLREVADILDAKILCCEDKLEQSVLSACGSDMMSDVLAYVKDQGVLLTGLLNLQVVRTCEMMDMVCICFVRGKTPDESTIELARSKGIVLMTTKERMFGACGKLYSRGLMNDGRCN